MATVAAGQKFLGIASTEDTTERRSPKLNAKSEFYTIEDLQAYASEDLAASGAASLTKPISYFTTAAAETATLAAGSEGQIKILHMVGNGGDAANTMEVTITNASWGTKATFNAADELLMLVYINAKWRVIANNGAVALA